jgi:predicted dehydrogenase
MTQSGTTSRGVAEKYGFEFCTARESDILADAKINTVFIATRHDSHGRYVEKALEAGKHVFVEKPLCINLEDLERIRRRHELSAAKNQLLMVGFNRRFSPLASLLKEKVGIGPMSIMYRVNAGPITPASWIQDPQWGGGRIIGEVCHFVDFLIFLNGSLPDTVHAFALPDPKSTEDTLNVSIRFENGSIGAISYFANGSKSLFKEYVEVYRNGVTAVLKDFKRLEIYGSGRTFKRKLFVQDKGQKGMVNAFIHSVKKGEKSPIRFDEIYAVSLATFKLIESLRTKSVVKI